MPRVRAPGILRGMSRAELRGTEPAVAEETQGIGLSRCALGGWFVCLQGSLRLGPAAAQPLRFSWEESDGPADSFVRRGESEARAH